jgi:crossover junction endodeoxyribonuclease RusA
MTIASQLHQSAGAGIARLLGDARKSAEWRPGSVGPAAREAEAIQAHPRLPATTLGASGGELRLELPWPPSINHYWRRHGHVIHVSTAGTRFARLCGLAVRSQFCAAPIDQPVAVLIEAWAATRRAWDVDNRCKPLLDALTRAGLWVDDSVVRDLRIVDRGRCRGGKVIVWIRPILEK